MTAKTINALIQALREEADELSRNPGGRMRGERVAVMSEWCQAAEAKAAFGVPRNRLRSWVCEGKVRAKKMDWTDPGSAVVYCVADIRRTVEALPDYMFAGQYDAPCGGTKDNENGNGEGQ